MKLNNKFRLAGFLFLSYDWETSTFFLFTAITKFHGSPQLVMFHLPLPCIEKFNQTTHHQI